MKRFFIEVKYYCLILKIFSYEAWESQRIEIFAIILQQWHDTCPDPVQILGLCIGHDLLAEPMLTKIPETMFRLK